MTRRLSFLVALLAASFVLGFAGVASAQSRTGWQMNFGVGVTDEYSPSQNLVLFDCAPQEHGDPCEYDVAVVPSQSDPGWMPAPDTSTIGFFHPCGPTGSVVCSAPNGLSCMTYGDFTFFQTLVTVPSNVQVTQFTIAFSDMDDGSRVTIYNSQYPTGIVIPGSYVFLGGSGTSDLSSFVVAGETNRVVVTQVDDCCCANDLGSAVVVLNGQIVVTNQPPVAQCQAVTALADATCSASASINNGSSDPDGDAVTCTQSPAGPYGLGQTSVTLTCADSQGATASCSSTVTVVDPPPSITCPANQTVECVHGGAAATFASSASDNCGAATSCSPASGSTFPLGATSDTCTATDSSGNTASCSFSVTVQDTQPPVVTTTGQRASYWPPNHKYETFSLQDCVTSVVDACEGTLPIQQYGAITRVTSDEPENAKGSGSTCDDIVITGSDTVNLRVERDGGGDGRVYTIYFVVYDNAGNAVDASCQAQVVHDQSAADATAVDSGCHLCEGQGCGTCPEHAAGCQ